MNPSGTGFWRIRMPFDRWAQSPGMCGAERRMPHQRLALRPSLGMCGTEKPAEGQEPIIVTNYLRPATLARRTAVTHATRTADRRHRTVLPGCPPSTANGKSAASPLHVPSAAKTFKNFARSDPLLRA